VQQAREAQLCAQRPPYGLKQLCNTHRDLLPFLASRRDPAGCAQRYTTCAVVGASARLVGAGYGPAIDGSEAVFRVNVAPDGSAVGLNASGSGRSREEWVRDLGVRTTWRVINAGLYYQRRRRHDRAQQGNGSDAPPGTPHPPLTGLCCCQPFSMGMCTAPNLNYTLGGGDARTHMLNPVLLHRYNQRYYSGRIQRRHYAPTTGYAAIVLALELCAETHIYGFGNLRDCGETCYHYYQPCGRAAPKHVAHRANERAWFKYGPPGGYHNFSHQAHVLEQMAQAGLLVPHWGSCVGRAARA
jgi:hypothetical protein